MLLLPKGEVIPAATLQAGPAAIRTYIEGKLKADNPALRWHLSGELSQLQDNTEARKTENRNGKLFTTQFPPYNWAWTMTLSMAEFVKWKSGYSLTAQATYDFMWIDVNGVPLGTAKADTTGAAGLGGVSLSEFVVEDWKQATPDQLAKFMFSVIIEDNSQINESLAMVEAGIIAADWRTLVVDALVTQGAANTSTSIKVQLFTDGVGAKTSLLARYGDVLDAAAAWIVKVDGVVVTPSAVTFDSSYDTNNGQMAFTITALTSGQVATVQLAALSVVSATPYFLNAVTEGTIYSYTHP